MTNSRHRLAAVLSLFIAACASLPRSGPAHFGEAAGAWSDGTSVLSIENDRVVTRESGDIVVRGYVREEPAGTWVLRNYGRIERWPASFDGDVLVLRERRFHRLQAKPSELDITPMTLVAKPIDAARVKAITDEIFVRNDREQKAMRAEVASKNAETTGEVKRILAENIAWLTKTVAEVGWIDATRFGGKASSLATVILKHSGTHALPLVLGAMPFVEHDFANHQSGNFQMFEILYDSLHLQLGGKQRYGTQVAADAKGNPYVQPVDDLTQVVPRRQELGDMPWDDYLALVSQMFYGGKTVSKVPPEE